MTADARGRVLYLTPLSHVSRNVRIVLRDGGVTLDDLLYFLGRYGAGR